MIRAIAWLLSAGLLAGCQNVNSQPTFDPFAGRTLPPPAFRGQPTPAAPYYPGAAPAAQPAWNGAATAPTGQPPVAAWPATPPANTAGAWPPNRSAPPVTSPAGAPVGSPAVAQPATPAQPYANPGAYGAPPTNAYPAGPATGLPPRTPYGSQPAPTFRPTSNPYPSQPVTIPPDMPGAGDGRTASRPISIPREAWEMPTTVTVRKPPLGDVEGLTPEDVPYPDLPGSPRRAGAADAPRLPPGKPAPVSPSQQALGRGKAPAANDQPFPWKLPATKPATKDVAKPMPKVDSGIRLVGHEEVVEEPAAPAVAPKSTGQSNRRMARLKPEQVTSALPRPRRIVIDTVPAVRAPSRHGVVTAGAEEQGRIGGLQTLPEEPVERIEPRTVSGPTVRTQGADKAAATTVDPPEPIDPPTAPAKPDKPENTKPETTEATDKAAPPPEKTPETTPTEPTPTEREPATPKAAETKPAEGQAPELKPTEPKPAESKTSEPKLPDGKPSETDATEPKSEAKPTEAKKPADGAHTEEPKRIPVPSPKSPETPPAETPAKKPSGENSEKPARPTAGGPPASRAAYDHAPDYAWIRGPVEYLEAEACWKLRYIPIDGNTDQYGGSVVLRNLPGTARLKPGETITVRGKPTRDKPMAAGFAPYYQVQSIER